MVLKQIKELNEEDGQHSFQMINRDILMQHFIMVMGIYNHSKNPTKAMNYYV